MSKVTKSQHEELKELKEMVEQSCKYFEKNNKRFNEFKKFVFDTSLSESDITKLRALNKPPLEFNTLEAYISRLLGEFAEHEPQLSVKASDGAPVSIKESEALIKTIEVIEAHLREVFLDSTNDNLSWTLYNDMLSGGFSVAKVYTDYLNEFSFEQKIIVSRVFDPTLTFFDPMARDSHKGDGRYCGELIPMTKQDFIEAFGKDKLEGITFNRAQSGFSWSYKNQDKDIALVVYLYKKVIKRERIIRLSNGEVILKRHREEMLKKWEIEGEITQPPQILEERDTNVERIYRYCFCEDKVLEVELTDYKYLPLVFFDGNSENILEAEGGASVQMTRPYVYHAKGVQKLKNFSGQTIANEIETMVQHKFKVALESIPEDYLDAYTNPQQAQTLIYNAFHKGDVNQPLPPPMEIQRTPTPPIVQETFLGLDTVTQTILGSYDASQGITDGNISGVAIKQGALHSNAAAKPYLMGYIKGLNRLAEIMIEQIPKYYRTARSLPIRKPNGMRSYVIINDEMNKDSVMMNYDPNNLQVKIEVGVNTSLQKQMALEQITRMMTASEMFARFINTDGLEILVDNLEIRGIENLKVKAEEFTQKLKQEEQQNHGQPDPMQQIMQLEAEAEKSRIEQKQTEAVMKHSIDVARLAIDEQKVEIDTIKAIADIQNKQQSAMLEEVKHDANVSKTAIDLALQASQHAQEMSMANEMEPQQPQQPEMPQ